MISTVRVQTPSVAVWRIFSTGAETKADTLNGYDYEDALQLNGAILLIDAGAEAGAEASMREIHHDSSVSI